MTRYLCLLLALLAGCASHPDARDNVTLADYGPPQGSGGGGGVGDFLADGSVPMTGNLDLDGNALASGGMGTLTLAASTTLYSDTNVKLGVNATATMTVTSGQIQNTDGTAAAPAYSFGEADSGLYRTSGGAMRLSKDNATRYIQVGSTEIQVGGPLWPDADGTRGLGAVSRAWGTSYVNTLVGATGGAETGTLSLAAAGFVDTDTTFEVRQGGNVYFRASSGVAYMVGNDTLGNAYIQISDSGGGNENIEMSAGVPVTVTANSLATALPIEQSEIADPTAPDADKARLYVRDNGSGKTQLVVVFSSGAAQVIATQP